MGAGHFHSRKSLDTVHTTYRSFANAVNTHHICQTGLVVAKPADGVKEHILPDCHFVKEYHHVAQFGFGYLQKSPVGTNGRILPAVILSVEKYLVFSLFGGFVRVRDSLYVNLFANDIA